MLVLQVRGANGTGKSTVVSGLLERYKDKIEPVSIIHGKHRIKCHASAGNKLFIIGEYSDSKTCGGCDASIKNADELKWVIAYVSKYIKPDVMVFEGVLYGKTALLATELNAYFKAIKAEFISICLEPSFEGSLERIYARNGGKEVAAEQLLKVWKGSIKSNRNIEKAGLKTIVYNTDNLSIEDTKMIIVNILKERQIEV